MARSRAANRNRAPRRPASRVAPRRSTRRAPARRGNSGNRVHLTVELKGGAPSSSAGLPNHLGVGGGIVPVPSSALAAPKKAKF